MKPLMTSIAIEDQKIILSEKMELNFGDWTDSVTIEDIETHYLCLYSSIMDMAIPSSPVLRLSFRFLREHSVI